MLALTPGGSAAAGAAGSGLRGTGHLPLRFPCTLDAGVALWCGPLTLHGLARWLGNRGERFPGEGFPYDEVKRAAGGEGGERGGLVKEEGGREEGALPRA